jgi:hypothetical protein
MQFIPDHVSPARITKIGEVFHWRGKMLRRGRGIYYAAHPADPTIERAYRKRQARRNRRLKIRMDAFAIAMKDLQVTSAASAAALEELALSHLRVSKMLTITGTYIP